MLTITGLNGIIYGQQEGIVLDDKFISREQFEELFKDLINNETEMVYMFKQNLLNIQKIQHIIETKKGQKISTTEFLSHLDTISNLFSTLILKGLGGNISLLTTFNFAKGKKTESYFLSNENDLPSRLLINDAKQYLNSQQQLNSLKLEANRLKKINDSLISHLNGFDSQLRKKDTQKKEERQRMYIWAHKNMRERFSSQRKIPHPISMAKYFWGGGQIPGYINEAFGLHLTLKHPNFTQEEHIEKLTKSVIAELGGAGSNDLFNLLYSTKGNTMSQLSGDIVVIDGNGRVQFNIQAKASRYSNYDFTIRYQKFIQNLYLFVEIYENALYNGINKKDIDLLFTKFSTKAWVPIKNEVEKQTSELIDKEILKPLINNK